MQRNKRTVSICLSDIPKDRIIWNKINGVPKGFVSLTLWDMPQMNYHDQNVEVQLTQNANDIATGQQPLKLGGGNYHDR